MASTLKLSRNLLMYDCIESYSARFVEAARIAADSVPKFHA